MAVIFRELKTLGDPVRIWGQRRPDKIAVIFQEDEYTWRELDEQSNRLAQALLAQGVKKGDKVAVLIHNIPEYVVVYFAIPKIGAVIVPVNVRFRSGEIKYILDNCDSTCLIMATQFLGEFEPIRAQVGLPQGVILIGRASKGLRLSYSAILGEDVEVKAVFGEQELSGYFRYEEIIKSYPEIDPEIEPGIIVDPDAEAIIWYTSGTTGFPKGAVHTHRQVLIGVEDAVDMFGLTEESRGLMVAPLFHNAYSPTVYAVHCVGGSEVIMPEFKTEEVLKAIDHRKPTFFFGVPAMFILMLDHPNRKKYDLSSIEVMGYGAAPMPVEAIEQLTSVVKCKLFNCYGQSEAGPPMAMSDPDTAYSNPSSVGRAMPSVRLKIVDDDDRELPPGQRGEICVQSKSIMLGYYKMPEATQETLRGGWLHTGDMGYLDEDGNLYLVDRKKDLMIRGGENIYPRELEEILYKHPKIRDAAVIGVPDRVMGEEVKAFIVPKNEQDITDTEVTDYCRQNMADYKVPKFVEVCNALPLNPSGKVDKLKLRERDKEKRA